MGKRTSYFKIDRRLLNSEFWLNEPFDKARAWIDLIGLASYKSTSYTSGGQIIALERGQLQTSENILAKRWQWSRSKVHRYLEQLTEQQMIQASGQASGTILTIENYGFYQDSQEAERTTERTTNRTTERTTYLLNKEIKINIKSLSIAREELVDMVSEFGEARLQTLIDELVDWKLNHPGVVIYNDAAKIRQFARDQQRWQEERNKRSAPSRRKTWDEIVSELEAEAEGKQ